MRQPCAITKAVEVRAGTSAPANKESEAVNRQRSAKTNARSVSLLLTARGTHEVG
jgi:hypothetical protein